MLSIRRLGDKSKYRYRPASKTLPIGHFKEEFVFAAIFIILKVAYLVCALEYDLCKESPYYEGFFSEITTHFATLVLKKEISI